MSSGRSEGRMSRVTKSDSHSSSWTRKSRDISGKSSSAVSTISIVASSKPTPSTLGTSKKALATKEEIQKELELIYQKLQTPWTPSRTDIPPDRLQNAISCGLLKNPQKAFLHRAVFAGKHEIIQGVFIEFTKQIIDEVNSHCYSEPLTGILIMFPNHILHIIEGAEDSINSYIKLTANKTEPSELDPKYDKIGKGVQLRPVSMLPKAHLSVLGIFQISDRAMLGWKSEKIDPPLFDSSKLPQGGFRKRLYKFIEDLCVAAICISRLNPVKYVAPARLLDEDIAMAKKQYETSKTKRVKSISNILPSVEMLNYILEKKSTRKIQLRSLREHMDFFWHSPPFVQASQTDYPIPGRTVTYD